MKRLVLTTTLALAVGAMGISCDKVKPPQPELKPDSPAAGTPDAQSKNLERDLSEAPYDLEKLKLATQESWSQVTETFRISLDKLTKAVKDVTEDRP